MADIQFESFELSNYKSVKSSPEIRISGITMFLGPNSSGKSNILESLLLLKQSFQKEGLRLRLNGPEIKLGEYRDVVHKHNIDKNIEYKFNFKKKGRQTDDTYECPICNSGYTYEGYYTNHLEDQHPNFWKEERDELSVYEGFMQSDSFIRLSFGFDEQTKTNRLEEFEFGYPPSIEGMFLSSIRLRQNKEGYQLDVKDINENKILDINIKKSEIQEDFSDEMRGLANLVSSVATSKGPTLARPYAFAALELPNLGENEKYPLISSHHSQLEQIIEKGFKKFETPEDRDEYEQYIQSLDENERLAIGLLARIAQSAREYSRGNATINILLDNITHVGPLRRNPQRIYFGSGGTPGQTGDSEQEIEELVFRDEQVQETNLIERTNEWLDKTGFDCEITISEVGVGDLYQLQVIEDGLSVNLADSGFGLSQVLPIIVKTVNMELEKEQEADEVQRRAVPPFRRDMPKIYTSLIQQPEIHLNPKIEAEIGDFFISIMNSGINLMIETHSEHLLNRIQRRVADGTIEDSNDINIYFFSKEEHISNIDKINISSEGVFDYWPEDFFQDDFEEAISILKESMGE